MLTWTEIHPRIYRTPRMDQREYEVSANREGLWYARCWGYVTHENLGCGTLENCMMLCESHNSERETLSAEEEE